MSRKDERIKNGRLLVTGLINRATGKSDLTDLHPRRILCAGVFWADDRETKFRAPSPQPYGFHLLIAQAALLSHHDY